MQILPNPFMCEIVFNLSTKKVKIVFEINILIQWWWIFSQLQTQFEKGEETIIKWSITTCIILLGVSVWWCLVLWLVFRDTFDSIVTKDAATEGEKLVNAIRKAVVSRWYDWLLFAKLLKTLLIFFNPRTLLVKRL